MREIFAPDCMHGQVVLVTGGASGIGAAIAKHCAKLGAKVALCGRTLERVQAGAENLVKEVKGAKAIGVACDVRDYEAVRTMFDTIGAQLGPVTGLVNNAAGNFYCTSEDLTPNGFRTIIDIVLHGTFNCSSVFGNILIREKRPGAILNIETTYTETGSSFILPSACAKAGVHALTTTLAYEWATYGIRVNGIAPGPFPTEGAWARLMPDKDFEANYKARHPMKRFGHLDELTAMAVFLLSDAASFITGESVVVDGGERLKGGQFNFVADMMPREKLKQTFAAMKTATKVGK